MTPWRVGIPRPSFGIAILKSRRICVKIKLNQVAETKADDRYDNNRTDRPTAPGGFAEAQGLSSAGR